MKNFELFLELTRLKKPIGFLLLFWPCLWGLTLANNFSSDNYQFINYCMLFLMGAILMRSAGCVVNDILDRKIDIIKVTYQGCNEKGFCYPLINKIVHIDRLSNS